MNNNNDFNNIYLRYRRYVYFVIGRYIADACTVEDLVQNTFMKAWVARHTFRGECTYQSWLTRIAINTALSHLTSLKASMRKGYKVDIDAQDCADPLDFVTQIISQEELNLIIEKVHSLPKQFAQVVVLILIQELSYEEVAQILGIPIGTVRSRLHRARYLLKDALQ